MAMHGKQSLATEYVIEVRSKDGLILLTHIDAEIPRTRVVLQREQPGTFSMEGH